MVQIIDHNIENQTNYLFGVWRKFKPNKMQLLTLYIQILNLTVPCSSSNKLVMSEISPYNAMRKVKIIIEQCN